MYHGVWEEGLTKEGVAQRIAHLRYIRELEAGIDPRTKEKRKGR